MRKIRLQDPPEGSKALRDALALALLTLLVFLFSNVFDLFNRIIRWISQHETWRLDQLSTVALFLLLGFIWYALRRHHELKEQIHRRMRLESEQRLLETQLQEAIADVETLTGLLPVCASCKRIRDGKGEWSYFEEFIQEHTAARLTQGYCPECSRTMYGVRTLATDVSGRRSESGGNIPVASR